MPEGGPIRGSWRRGEDYHAGSDCTPLASTEECGQINQRADQSVTHRVIPSASRSSASEALGQSSHAWLSISNCYSAQHSHVWNNLTWTTLTIKPLICVCVSGYTLLRQSHFTDLGKQFGIFIRGERVPLVGGGSYVALYLASSYSCKCNLCNLNAGSWKEQSWEWNQRLRRKEEQTTFTFTQTSTLSASILNVQGSVVEVIRSHSCLQEMWWKWVRVQGLRAAAASGAAGSAGCALACATETNLSLSAHHGPMSSLRNLFTPNDEMFLNLHSEQSSQVLRQLCALLSVLRAAHSHYYLLQVWLLHCQHLFAATGEFKRASYAWHKTIY